MIVGRRASVDAFAATIRNKYTLDIERTGRGDDYYLYNPFSFTTKINRARTRARYDYFGTTIGAIIEYSRILRETPVEPRRLLLNPGPALSYPFVIAVQPLTVI